MNNDQALRCAALLISVPEKLKHELWVIMAEALLRELNAVANHSILAPFEEVK